MKTNQTNLSLTWIMMWSVIPSNKSTPGKNKTQKKNQKVHSRKTLTTWQKTYTQVSQFFFFFCNQKYSGIIIILLTISKQFTPQVDCSLWGDWVASYSIKWWWQKNYGFMKITIIFKTWHFNQIFTSHDWIGIVPNSK